MAVRSYALVSVSLVVCVIGVWWYSRVPPVLVVPEVPMAAAALVDGERPLVIVIPSYNNKAWYEKNLDSVFAQKYTNYRLIYIDDCSSDGTGALVCEYITHCNQQHRCTVITNNQRRRALANHYTAVHSCADHEIIVNLDGDDWFAHDRVLARVNAAYEDPRVWLTYGQYEEYPSGKRGHSRRLLDATIKLNCYRECDWVTSALRTFYAGLFKQIRLADLLYRGDFFHTACDLAFMFPMLEMAAGRCLFIDEILYIYNCQTPHNDFKESFLLQTHTDNYIRSRSKYRKIASFESCAKNTVGVFIFCDDDISDFETLMVHAQTYLHGVAQWHILVSDDVRADVPQLRNAYPDVCWHVIAHERMPQEVAAVFETSAVDYCLCMPHDAEITREINMAECATWMCRTHAQGFCLSVGMQMEACPYFTKMQCPELCRVTDEVCAWLPHTQAGPWKLLDSLFCVLRSRSAACRMLSEFQFCSFKQLQRNIQYRAMGLNELYLCGHTPYFLIPLTQVPTNGTI